MYAWMRTKEIFIGEPCTLFMDGSNPNDVKQGELSDCYLLSALSAIAER